MPVSAVAGAEAAGSTSRHRGARPEPRSQTTAKYALYTTAWAVVATG